MNTVWTERKIIDGKKVLVLDSDCQFNINAIKESIQVINNLKADYGLLTLWGIELKINANDVAENVFENFKMTMRKLRGEES